MKDKKMMIGLIVVLTAVAMWWMFTSVVPAFKTPLPDNLSKATAYQASTQQDENIEVIGEMNLGKFTGRVVYDKSDDYHYVEFRGARFPFKANPLEADKVPLELDGETPLEKNTALLLGLLGKPVMYMTIIVNPDEEEEVMPAVSDIMRYVQIVNRKKFNGIAYTKEGGKLKNPVFKGKPVQTLDDATPGTPKLLIKGPGSGAETTRITTEGNGRFIIEGKTYSELNKAATKISITMMKMLCGSPDCPDASQCATGGSCGCSKK